MRVPRHVSMELIKFVKRVEVVAHFWDSNSRSAFEIARQMSSPKLNDANADYEFVMNASETSVEPKIKVDFLDGSSWEQGTAPLSASELRGELFEKAADAGDAVEAAGGRK
jgi:hypothetical protein|tara:strand:- start:7836 stop:8168 length:333 start_codon:yes stop_codon:yes gene_type:complete